MLYNVVSFCCTLTWTSYMYTYIPSVLDLLPPVFYKIVCKITWSLIKCFKDWMNICKFLQISTKWKDPGHSFLRTEDDGLSDSDHTSKKRLRNTVHQVCVKSMACTTAFNSQQPFYKADVVVIQVVQKRKLRVLSGVTWLGSGRSQSGMHCFDHFAFCFPPSSTARGGKTNIITNNRSDVNCD